MTRLPGAAAVALVVLAAVATHAVPARADATDTVLVSGYVLSLGFSGIATAVNGASLAYDQPSSRGWRILGMTAGGVDVLVGTGLLIGANNRSEGIVLGSLAVALGAAALTTGYFASEDIHVGVMVSGTSGGGLFVAGRF